MNDRSRFIRSCLQAFNYKRHLHDAAVVYPRAPQSKKPLRPHNDLLRQCAVDERGKVSTASANAVICHCK